MAVNGRLNTVVVPNEIIWKWQQYGNNFITAYPLSLLQSKVLFNLSVNNPVVGSEIKVTFNEMLFEQSVTFFFSN